MVTIKNKVSFIQLLILTVFSAVYSLDVPGGEQFGDYSAGRYRILSTITVPKGETMTINPGSVFSFSSYAGVKVYGTLRCIGTENEPVYLIADTTSASIQWSGIELLDSSSLELTHTCITNTVFGIRSPHRNTSIKLIDVLFSENGEDLSVEDSLILLSPKMPYTAVFPTDTLELPSGKDLTAASKPVKRALGISSGFLTVASAVSAIVNHRIYREHSEGYADVTESVSEYRYAGNRALYLRNTSLGLFAGFSAFFTINLIF